MDISAMLISFTKEITGAVWRLLWVLGALVGTLYVGSALLRMSRASRLPGQQAVTVGDILPIILVGALLLNLSVFINTAWNSMASGTVSYGAVSYAQAADFGKFADAINAVLTLASLAGGCYFFKGVVLLKKASMEGQSSQGADDSVWRALTHMLGGCLLVQIADTIERFRQSAHLFW
jgi:hypothetical protein